MFNEEIRTKQDLSYISTCSLSILYNSKFILMATSLETNAVVVMRVHCILLSLLLMGCKNITTKTSNIFIICYYLPNKTVKAVTRIITMRMNQYW